MADQPPAQPPYEYKGPYKGVPMYKQGVAWAFPKKEEITDEESVADFSLAIAAPSLDLPSTSGLTPIRQRAKRTRSSKNRSQFLRYFMETDDPSQLSCVVCNAKVRYMYGTKKVTSSLRDHLTAYHQEVMEELDNGDARHEQAQLHLLKAFATGELNLDSADSLEVRAFAKALDPTFAFPVPDLYTTVLDEEYKSVHASVSVSLLGQDVAITVDDWKFQWGITASFIDSDWQRQFVVLPLMKSEKPLRNLLSLTQHDYGIKKLSACITDIESVQAIGSDGEKMDRFGCILRALDSLVNDSLAAFDEGTELISRIRKLCIHLRTNEKTWDELKRKTVEVRWATINGLLPISTEGSWDSSLRMMRAVQLQMEHLDDSFRAAGLFPPTNEEIEMISSLVAFLGEIEDFAIKMSNHNSTLSSLIPYIKGLEKTIDELKNGPLRDYYPHLRTQFERLMAPYKQSALIRRAYLLDPRFLHLGLLDDVTRAADLVALFKEADDGYSPEVTEEPPKKRKRSNLLSKAAVQPLPEMASHAKREYDILFDIACKSDLAEDADICEFWRTHKGRLSRLASIARRLLAIPSSSIPVNRYISEMGSVASVLGDTGPKEPEQKKKLLFLGVDSKKRMLRFDDADDYHLFSHNQMIINEPIPPKI